MKIRQKLAYFLCPEMRETELHVKRVSRETEHLRKILAQKESNPEPNMADLMRANLKSITVEASESNPPDYLGGIDEADKIQRIARVNDLWSNEMFHEIFRYLVNKQANYTLKEAVNDAQIFTGRMNINGMSLFKDEVERCHALFEDMTKPEDFNPNEVV